VTLEHRQVSDLDCYEAVVLGRAVYMGHWLEPARKFVECFGSDLAERQTCLFSSGPVGDPSRAPKAAVGAKEADYRDWERSAAGLPRSRRKWATLDSNKQYRKGADDERCVDRRVRRARGEDPGR
jgi:hypothetical protein